MILKTEELPVSFDVIQPVLDKNFDPYILSISAQVKSIFLL